jgi:hypothetical protein
LIKTKIIDKTKNNKIVLIKNILKPISSPFPIYTEKNLWTDSDKVCEKTLMKITTPDTRTKIPYSTIPNASTKYLTVNRDKTEVKSDFKNRIML